MAPRAPVSPPTERARRLDTLTVWIAEARPGDRAVYHRGHLAIDRLQDPSLDRLAQEVYVASNVGAIPVVTACRHLARYEPGLALLRLVAEPEGPDRSRWRYLAEKI